MSESVLDVFLAPVLDHLVLIEGNKKNLSPSTAVSDIAEYLDNSKFASVDVRGKSKMFASAAFQKTASPRTGSLTLGFDESQLAPDQMVEPLLAAASALGAPWATIGFTTRSSLHSDAYQAVAPDGHKRFDLDRGLSGVAPVTVVGPDLVDHFGESSLQALPEAVARSTKAGFWVLTPCEFTEWTADSWCDAERAVIEAIGADKFFDPETGRLPTVAPALPDRGTFAGRIIAEFGSDEWVRLDTPGEA